MALPENDVSYLYSDDYPTPSSSNQGELLLKTAETSQHEPQQMDVNWKTAAINHQSKHAVMLGEKVHKRKRQLSTAQKHRAKRLTSEQDLLSEIERVEYEQSEMEMQLAQIRLCKTNLSNVINSIFPTQFVNGCRLDDDNRMQ